MLNMLNNQFFPLLPCSFPPLLLSIHPYLCPSVPPNVHQSVCPSVLMSTLMYVCQSVLMCVRLSTRPPNCLSMNPSV